MRSFKKIMAIMTIATFVVLPLWGCAPATTEQPAAPEAAPAEETAPVEASKYKIAFVAGVNDPFYITMQRGAQKAADMLGVELIVQIPDKWDAAVQTPIIESMIARGDIDLLFTAPVDKEGMIGPLKNVVAAGIPVITVDTYLGDSIYEAGHPADFPLSYIGSDNVEGGRIAAGALAELLGGKGKVYVQNVKPGISTTDQREEGFKEGIEEFPNMQLVGVDYNDDDSSKAQAQTLAVLQREPDLAGIFGTNVFSAQGAGTAVKTAGKTGLVKVVAFDATEVAIEQLRAGVVDLVIAQKPAEMGFYSIMLGVGYLEGFTDLPKRVTTGYAVITRDNVDDPNIAQYIYTGKSE